MGLKQEDFTDDSTGVVLTAAYVSFKSSQVTILPDASGTYTIGAAAGIWKDKAARDAGKAALAWKDVVVKTNADDIEKSGVYSQLYATLKTLMPGSEDA